jgi:hypothetical protein
MNQEIKYTIRAAIYFIASSIITWWFIVKGQPLYSNSTLMLISCSIAGAKWGLQIVAALYFMGRKKWRFIHAIGLTCLVGSCILLPYCLISQIRLIDNSFLYSLIAAVVVMIALYYRSVKKLGIGTQWFWAWMGSLAVAISLQLFVIFKVSF